MNHLSYKVRTIILIILQKNYPNKKLFEFINYLSSIDRFIYNVVLEVKTKHKNWIFVASVTIISNAWVVPQFMKFSNEIKVF